MTRSSWLIVAGAAAFLVFILAGVPASVALRWLGPAGLRLAGVTGSLWRGSADSVDFAKLRLGETHWSLSPLALVLGRIGGDVEARIGDGAARGALAVSFAGSLSCRGCSYEGPVASLRPMIPALKAVDGTLKLDMTALEISKHWPTRAVGSAKLSNVPFGGTGQPRGDGPVAAFETTLSADPVPANGLIEATVQDAGGPLELTARISITPPGNFEFSGRARARPDAPPEIARALAVLGPKSADGRTAISVSGSF